MILEFEDEEQVMGMNTYRYGTPGYGMENATLNPHHKGFYCFGPNGLLNLTAAVNAPVMVSKPSFLQGDHFLHEEITGELRKNVENGNWHCKSIHCIIVIILKYPL